jgi:hypothetical protein
VRNSNCPNGKGIGINTAEWNSRAANWGDDYPGLAAAMLPNGNTLVVASGAPKPDTAIAVEFRTPCALEPSFGQDGATLLSGHGFGVNIADVLPTSDGGALIAGSTNPVRGRWLVGKISADGQLDQAFGDVGWARLARGYSVWTMALAHDGSIIVGGGGNTNGSSFLMKLSADGQPDADFGVGGRTTLPAWHDGGVQGLWVEPDGNVLALVGGGNMGCWGLTAVTVTPSGATLPGFRERFAAGLNHADPNSHVGFPVFVGDVVAGPDGFHLLGTAQDDCVDNPGGGRANPSEHFSDVAFHYDGQLDTGFGVDGVANFSAGFADQAWALPQADGTVLLAVSPHDGGWHPKRRAEIRFYSVNSAGHLQTGYGDSGVADITLPYSLDSDAAVGVQPAVTGNGRHAAIVTVTSRGDAVIITPVPAR